ncbi:RNA 2',3'-cyclic phosphodiesterase [Streptomyces sp. NPDC059063]|uniref:RNA 2',3'-cyclic phosphodiesterase n=1 Tax=unclassified Streptomyces TaxID=2593676 RepID=UPI0036B47906
MRLFAAVLPPEPVTAELALSVERLRALPGADRLRWTDRAGWHFTLAFMGEVADELVAPLGERLARAARRTDPFTLALRGGGRFDGRALWAGVGGEVAALRMLARRADAGARRAGVVMADERGYRPHLTLARGRGEVDLRPYVGALAEFEGPAWEVGELALVRSHLPGGGVAGERPRYEVVGAWDLAGRP